MGERESSYKYVYVARGYKHFLMILVALMDTSISCTLAVTFRCAGIHAVKGCTSNVCVDVGAPKLGRRADVCVCVRIRDIGGPFALRA